MVVSPRVTEALRTVGLRVNGIWGLYVHMCCGVSKENLK